MHYDRSMQFKLFEKRKEKGNGTKSGNNVYHTLFKHMEWALLHSSTFCLCVFSLKQCFSQTVPFYTITTQMVWFLFEN